jgi:co-chaperonin GroES (HSP10)
MFEPLNRYIQIDLEQPSPHETATGVLLPQDFKPTEERHVVASVVAWSTEVRFADQLSAGTKVLVDKSMVERLVINGVHASIVLDNYILGLIK